MCICVYVHMCICVYVYICIRVYVHMCICVYVYMCRCNVCMYVCTYVCMYVRTYVRMYVCMCVYIYIYICISGSRKCGMSRNSRGNYLPLVLRDLVLREPIFLFIFYSRGVFSFSQTPASHHITTRLHNYVITSLCYRIIAL